MNAIILNTNFINNDQLTQLFLSLINGDLSIMNSNFTDNDANTNLIYVKNIGNIHFINSGFSNNDAANANLIHGENMGNVTFLLILVLPTIMQQMQIFFMLKICSIFILMLLVLLTTKQI